MDFQTKGEIPSNYLLQPENDRLRWVAQSAQECNHWVAKCPWSDGLTTGEKEEMSRALPLWSEMSSRERWCCYHADFSLTEHQTFLHTRQIREISQSTLERIQQICFDTKGYVPYILRNTRFESKFTVTVFKYSTPDLTSVDIESGQIIGYREKIDGALVWRAEYSDGVRTYFGWAGGLSSPAYLASVDTFEVTEMNAYSIRPWNVEASILLVDELMIFVERPLRFQVDREWREGAIVLMQTRQSIVEKKVKRIPTAEIRVNNQVAIIGGSTYPIEDDGGGLWEDGVYEAAMLDGRIEIVAYRPWKTPTKNFFKAMRAATVHDLVDIPQMAVVFEGVSVSRLRTKTPARHYVSDSATSTPDYMPFLYEKDLITSTLQNVDVLYLPVTQKFPLIYGDARIIGGSLQLRVSLARSSETVHSRYTVEINRLNRSLLVTGSEIGCEPSKVEKKDGITLRPQEEGRLIFHYYPDDLVLRSGLVVLKLSPHEIFQLDSDNPVGERISCVSTASMYYWLFSRSSTLSSPYLVGSSSTTSGYMTFADYGRSVRGHFTTLALKEQSKSFVPVKKKSAFSLYG